MTGASGVALWRLACLFSRESNKSICPHAAEFGATILSAGCLRMNGDGKFLYRTDNAAFQGVQSSDYAAKIKRCRQHFYCTQG
jgi:hypothetical protein